MPNGNYNYDYKTYNSLNYFNFIYIDIFKNLILIVLLFSLLITSFSSNQIDVYSFKC